MGDWQEMVARLPIQWMLMEMKQLLRPRSGGEEIKRSIWKEKEQCMHGKGDRLMKRPPGHLARIDS
eukprot:jgi/Picsp_1/3627/NSC_06464-R1_---NA---